MVNNMFGLPQLTEVNKRIPKQRFYENLDITNALKKIFVTQIKTIIWANKIAPTTTNIAEGNEVKEIEIFKISLNSGILDQKALEQMDKQIPYHILFILEYQEKYQLWIGYKQGSKGANAFKVNKYFYTEWIDEKSVNLNIQGFTTDEVYHNLICRIGNVNVADSSTLEQQIEADDKRQKLEKEIARLEKKARAEKQPKKKFELVQQIKKLKSGLETQN